jgi:hypothetical protein
MAGVLVFTFAVSLLTGMTFGLAPALGMARTEAYTALKGRRRPKRRRLATRTSAGATTGAATRRNRLPSAARR